jgi:hypothetical protein
MPDIRQERVLFRKQPAHAPGETTFQPAYGFMSIFWLSRTCIGALTSSPVSRAIERRFTSAKGIKDVGAHGYGSG